jgi:hypothetical protein
VPFAFDIDLDPDESLSRQVGDDLVDHILE